MTLPFHLHPIGIVRSPLRTRDEAPKQGDEGTPEAWLELDPAVAEAARELRADSEVLVFTWLDRGDRSVLAVHPRDDAAAPLTGVFSTRSQDRPNPIGLHRCRILEVAPGHGCASRGSRRSTARRCSTSSRRSTPGANDEESFVMSKLRVSSFTVSLDGYGAGPDQGIENPLGAGGEALHEWLVATRTFSRLSGRESGSTGPDDELAARGFADVGAWIMGRNMFGPVRGPWADESWRGWWGENPPYHCSVFVLTHHPRAPLSMADGTAFHFVTGGIHEALERAVDAAGGKDVRLGGGAATIRQYLRAGLVDELHLAVSPILLGSGEHLLAGIDLVRLGYRCAEHVPTPAATHYVLARSG